VTSAFFGSDFVTVSKTEDCPWAVLKPDVFAAIMDHFSSGEPLFTDASAAASDTAINDDDTEVKLHKRWYCKTCQSVPTVSEEFDSVSLFLSWLACQPGR